MTKLLPCPFCGGSATMEQTGDYRWSVGCDSANEPTCMGYQSFTTFARQGEASEAWNRRAAILPQRMPDREAIARAIYDVETDWLVRGGIGIPLCAFEKLSERDRNLHLAYADAVLALTRPECGEVDPTRPACGQGDERGRKPTNEGYGHD